MKTDMEYIAGELDGFGAEVRIASPETAAIDFVCVWDEGTERYQEHVLYMLPASEVRPEQLAGVKNLLLPVDWPYQSHLEDMAEINQIIIAREIEYDLLVRVVEQVRRKRRVFEQIRGELIEAMCSGQGLQPIVEAGRKLLGNPLAVMDNSYRIMAISLLVEPSTVAFEKTFELGYISNDTLGQLKKQRRLDYILKNCTPCETRNTEQDTDSPPYGWLDISIRIQEQVAAYITVYGMERPFTAYDYDCLTELARLASLELQKSEFFMQNRGLMYESLMYDVLDGKLVDNLVITMRMRSLGVTLSRNLYVAVVSSTDARTVISAGTQKVLRELMPRSISVVFENALVFMLNREDKEVPLLEDVEVLHDILSTGRLKMGVSKRFFSFRKIRRYYEQGMKAIELGKNLDGVREIYYYDDYSIYHAIEICSAVISLNDLCHPVILELNFSEDPMDKELLRTLYVYLIYMKNVPKITGELHIHKSTLFYRINRLKEMIGEDLDNGYVMTRLLFSFFLIQYTSSFQPHLNLLPLPRVFPRND